MNEKKIQLILGNHAHVPLGSSEKEFEYVYTNKMRPFITNLYRYSNIQAVLHYSGVLLYWIERTHPEFFMLIEDMVAKKQAEILSGGFYEPMFPVIPSQDRIGQIELLTTYLRKHFGKRPSGCWIPFMAWEQNMVTSISASGMNYTFLSKDQFIQAGMDKELFFPCISEDQGKLIYIFPVDLSIEKELAEKSFSQVFIELKKTIDESNHLKPEETIISVFPQAVCRSPQEAPDTAWNRFFEEITLSQNFVETVLPAKILKRKKILKRGAFQNSTAFGNGYSPRRYLIDNCEANNLYSKMIFTNALINQLKGDKSRKQSAREELWKAQDSTLFTYGNEKASHEIRKAAYNSLLRAEQLSRENEKIVSSVIIHDFDFDGVNEYLFQDSRINCYLQLNGASIFELDYLPKAWNYLDCGKSAYLESTRNTAFADVLLPPGAKIEKLHDFIKKDSRLAFNEQFEPLANTKKGTSCFKLVPCGNDIPYGIIEITKCYSFKKDTINVSYSLKNTGKIKQSFCLVTELNLSFAGGSDEFVRFYTTDANGKDMPIDRFLENISNLKILDVKNEVQILLNSAKKFSLLLSPILDNNVYQASKIKTAFFVSLDAQESWNNEFSLKFSY